jgi:hypothetical protein
MTITPELLRETVEKKRARQDELFTRMKRIGRLREELVNAPEPAIILAEIERLRKLNRCTVGQICHFERAIEHMTKEMKR